MKKIVFVIAFLASPVVLADEAELSKQIMELKNELRAQNERITQLEKLVYVDKNSEVKVGVVDKFAWQTLSNWNRVQPGMSRLQVESILGKPTNVKVSIIDYVTLYYQGEKSGAGYVSGNIELNNQDRVMAAGINKPVM